MAEMILAGCTFVNMMAGLLCLMKREDGLRRMNVVRWRRELWFKKEEGCTQFSTLNLDL
jgi:hypothetical protein